MSTRKLIQVSFIHSLFFLRKISWLFSRLVAPQAKNKDLARREHILNILLIGSIVLSAFANIITWTAELFTSASEKQASSGASVQVLLILLFFLVAFWFSKHGKSLQVAYALIIVYLIASTYILFRWGADLPQGLLTYALIIVMTGVLISSKFAFLITLYCSISLLSITQSMAYQIYIPNTMWKSNILTIGDSIVSALTLFVISIVAWLSNKEIERALKRAQNSETTLRRERDNLEVIVEQRTTELRIAQAEKISQLYKFAEFGRSASALFHDLVNPLTLVSLNLNQLKKKNSKLQHENLLETQLLIKRAIQGTKKLEHFIHHARMQIRSKDTVRKFSLYHEIKKACDVLEPKRSKLNVLIHIANHKNITTVGNPFKFSQIITNLVSNAIDSYSDIEKTEKKVEITVNQIENDALVTIHDYGMGIEQSYINRIFDPFFTTKDLYHGIGIGLFICKNTIEKDFSGTISVESNKTLGTIFTLRFPLK